MTDPVDMYQWRLARLRKRLSTACAEAEAGAARNADSMAAFERRWLEREIRFCREVRAQLMRAAIRVLNTRQKPSKEGDRK